MRRFVIVGGPLDGQEVPDPSGFFSEGERVAVDSRNPTVPGSHWSPEGVYQVQGRRLLHDAKATTLRRLNDLGR